MNTSQVEGEKSQPLLTKASVMNGGIHFSNERKGTMPSTTNISFDGVHLGNEKWVLKSNSSLAETEVEAVPLLTVSSSYDDLSKPVTCQPHLNSNQSIVSTGAIPKIQKPDHQRHSSDDAVKSVHQTDGSGVHYSLGKKRSSSEYDVRAAALQARMEEKFQQLHKDMASKAQKNAETLADEISFDSAYGEMVFDSNRGQQPSTQGPEAMSVSRGPLHSGSDLALESVAQDSSGRGSFSFSGAKEATYARLKAELLKAQQDLKLKDEEVSRLNVIRDEVGAELQDLTASLFEAANDMVREANIKRVTAEKQLQEALYRESALQADIVVLKNLLQTSQHNTHLSLSPTCNQKSEDGSNDSVCNDESGSPDKHVSYEVDPVPYQEFVKWRQNPEVNKSTPFLSRIYKEDILPCLTFENKELSDKVLLAVENNAIIIESITDKNKFTKLCSLLKVPRFCKYKMNLGVPEEWHYISALCRNRITAVCNFLCYLRYINQGLVKNSIHKVYWNILQKRRKMVLARLGLDS